MFMGSLWDKYDSDATYDEYLGEDNKLRKQAKVISNILEKIGSKKLQEIEKNCASTISARGINFRVYSSGKKAQEKKWPLDIIPRIIPKRDWSKVSKGLLQRVKALNLFIDDVYNDKKIFKDNSISLLDIYVCIDHPDKATEKRKPGPGMFLEAELDHDLLLMDCLMIGDSIDDIRAGEMLGMDTMLVLTGRGQETMSNLLEYEMPTYIVEDLSHGVEKLCH